MVRVKVLWVSRHTPLPRQVERLREVFGDVEIVQFPQNVPSAEWLVDNVILPGGFKYVVVVLPLGIVAKLVELARVYGFTVLWGEMEAKAILESSPIPGVDYDPSCEVALPAVNSDGSRCWRILQFKDFYRVEDVKLVLSPLAEVAIRERGS